MVIAIHDRQLAEPGGSAGVRDTSLLESALTRPQRRYAYGDPRSDLANLDVGATDEDKCPTMLTLAEGNLSEKDFAIWLRTHLRADIQGRVHEPRASYKPKSRTGKPPGK